SAGAFFVRSASGEARPEAADAPCTNEYISGRGRGSNEASRRYGGKTWVASRDPVTYRNSLWLLPSGPDQIHDPAMRGDPPLIGCALRRTCIIAAIHSSHWRPPRRGCRRGYNLPHILHCGIHVSRPPLPAPPPAP